jgi:hypothetical protein
MSAKKRTKIYEERVVGIEPTIKVSKTIALTIWPYPKI